jgi:uncharacterized membrane protein YhaH (DUF805 family)
MEWYLMVWQRYADFNGRSRRKEYWMFTLFNVIIMGALEIVAFASFTSTKSSIIGVIFGLAIAVYGLAALVPALACSVRRLHDIGMSGWLLLISLVPFLGGLALLVLFLMDSNPGPNQYGPNPKLNPQLTMNS